MRETGQRDSGVNGSLSWAQMRRCFYYPDGLDRISKLKPGCLWNNAVHETETDVVTERR
jgi:hypothetical protein